MNNPFESATEITEITDVEVTTWPQNDADAQTAHKLRGLITIYARRAVDYGNVDRGWVNTQLARLGAEQVTGTSEYRINVPITGVYGRRVNAESRTAALAIFQQHLDAALAKGKIVADGSYDNVYKLALNTAAGGPQFYSGPEDPSTEGAQELTLDGLRDGIRQMLKDGVAEHGWGYSYAQRALAEMGLVPLPPQVSRTVEVPVAGTAKINVAGFEDDTDEDVQASVAAKLAKLGHVNVKPDEVGQFVISPSAS